MPAREGWRQAKLVAALGQVARNGRSCRLLLRTPAADRGVCLTFGRGALTGVTAPRGAGWDPAQLDLAALKETIERVALEAAALGADPELLPEAESSGAGRAPIGGLNAADLAIDISRRIEDTSCLKRDSGRGWLGEKLRPPASPPPILPRQALGPGEAFLLSRADGTVTLQQILDTSPFTEEETLRALFALQAVGMLTPATQTRPAAAPKPAGKLMDLDRFLARTGSAGATRPHAGSPGRPEPPRQPSDEPAASSWTPAEMKQRAELDGWQRTIAQADHYTRLGVERSADEPTIRRAYYRQARQYHPDRLKKPHLEDMERHIESAFASITEAYNTLTDSKARSEYDRELIERASGRRKDQSEKSALARDAYLRARKYIEEHEAFEAIQLLETAVEHDPTRAEYFHLLGACQGLNPRWRKKAEENLLKAIALNPSSTQSYLELARVYHKGGLERRAREMYERVLAWDPSNEEALAHVKPKAPEAHGRLRHLFGKD